MTFSTRLEGVLCHDFGHYEVFYYFTNNHTINPFQFITNHDIDETERNGCLSHIAENIPDENIPEDNIGTN